MAATVYFARHGETDFSREDRFCGDTDAPLNARGRAMAEALAEHYAGVAWAGLYASPMQRALDTVAPLAARVKLPVVQLAGLREISYGSWEGRSEKELRGTPAFDAWAADPAKNAPPGGETALSIAARANTALADLRAAHPDGNVLVVSHKATIRILVCVLLGVDLARFRDRIGMPEASVTQVEFRGARGPLLVRLGDTAHLTR